MKILKSEKDYQDNPTNFERVSAEILRFPPTSSDFFFIVAVRFERNTEGFRQLHNTKIQRSV